MSTNRLSQWSALGFARVRRPPPWVNRALAAFCAIELVLLGYARATSAVAHLHALQDLTPSASAGDAAAGCAEADAALADLAPVLLPLNAGRLMPFATARAWGEVPRLAEAAQVACRSVEVYAGIAPWPEASLEQGAAVDVLTDVRRQRPQLALAGVDLTHAWSLLEAIDLGALSAEPRFERAVRALTGLRAQQADISDALALATAERAETLLGGRGALAWVLEVTDGGGVNQAHVIVEEGRVVAANAGPPPVPAAVVVTVDRLGLSTMLTAVGGVPVPELGGRVEAADLDGVLKRSPDGTTGAIARAVLLKITQKKLADDAPALAALKKGVEQHSMRLWFADSALQALVVRHDWAQP